MPTPPHTHGTPETLGVLLINLGTPSAPTPRAVRQYLKQFLSDPRVIQAPRLLWWLILRLVILPFRPRRTARAYQKIWRKNGSPLLIHTRRLAQKLQRHLNTHPQTKTPIHIQIAMTYGDPSIPTALAALRRANAQKILILPLYPQYSATTTAAAFDAIAAELKRHPRLPELRYITHYHDHPAYIRALANAIRRHRKTHGTSQKLLLSYHGIPQSYFTAGDPYHCECHKTTRLLAAALRLKPHQYQLAFQSRLGTQKWLTPYTDQTLTHWAQQGIHNIQIICPGFSVDCLETLEETALQNRHLFLHHAQKTTPKTTQKSNKKNSPTYTYIPCLNDHPDHIHLLTTLILQNITPWQTTHPQTNTPTHLKTQKHLARTLGATR